MYKRKLLNYITIICAISTVGMALYSSRTIKNNIMCFVMLIITITVNYFSNKCNEKDIEIKVIINGLSKEEEKDLVEKLKNDKIYLKDISNTITIENNNSCDK